MRSRLDKVVKAMKEQGFTKFGAVGYCFGGVFVSPNKIHSGMKMMTLTLFTSLDPASYVFDYAFDKITDVSVVTHPSRLEITDLEVIVFSFFCCPYRSLRQC